MNRLGVQTNGFAWAKGEPAAEMTFFGVLGTEVNAPRLCCAVLRYPNGCFGIAAEKLTKSEEGDWRLADYEESGAFTRDAAYAAELAEICARGMVTPYGLAETLDALMEAEPRAEA